MLGAEREELDVYRALYARLYSYETVMMNSPNACEACGCALRTVRAYCDPCGARRRMVLACVPATVVEFQMRFVRSSFREAVPDVLKQFGDVSACRSLDEDTSRRICTAIADSHEQQPGLIVPGDAVVPVKVCGNCPVFADLRGRAPKCKPERRQRVAVLRQSLTPCSRRPLQAIRLELTFRSR
jgi:hypothetical protein